MPKPLSIKEKQRLSQIISVIRENNPDVIALQEVWLSKYAKEIERQLKEYTFTMSGSFFYNKSGLVTGVKKSNDIEINYFPFTKKHSLVERVARKGYHSVKLSNDLFFVNTHLYTQTNDAEKAITASQFRLIQKLMPTKQVIVAGDLNLNERELNKFNIRFDYDTSYGLTISSSNYLTQARCNKFLKQDLKIDYLLATKEKTASLVTKCITKPIVSDHYMLLSSIKIKAS